MMEPVSKGVCVAVIFGLWEEGRHDMMNGVFHSVSKADENRFVGKIEHDMMNGELQGMLSAVKN